MDRKNRQRLAMIMLFMMTIIFSLAFAYTIGWWLVWLVGFIWSALLAYSANEVIRDLDKEPKKEEPKP